MHCRPRPPQCNCGGNCRKQAQSEVEAALPTLRRFQIRPSARIARFATLVSQANLLTTFARVRPDPDALIALGLFGFALVVRVGMLVAYPFDGLYGQDAYAYYDYAAALRAALEQGQPIPPFFWPLGYPLHVVAASWIAARSVQPAAGQLASVLAGALIAPLTFALSCETLRPIHVRAQRVRHAGLIAGLIVATAGQLMISSLSIMSDAAGLAWATASAVLTLRYTRTLRPGTLVLAALTLSLAVMTRWVFGLLALPWTIGVLLAWRRNWASIGLRRAIALGLMAVVAGGSLAGGQLLASRGDSHTGDLQVVGWDATNAVRSEVVNSDGAFRYDLPTGVYYAAQPLLHPAFLFPLFAPLWLAGLRSFGRLDGSTRALLIGWPLAVYIFLAGIAWQNPRFALALFPPLAVWTGIGYDRLWERRPGWRRGLLGLAALALIGALFWSLRVVNDFVARKNADVARAQRAVAQVPPGARLITFGLTLTLRHYSDLDVIEIYEETPASLPDRACGGGPAYLYVDVANLEQQWAGLAPQVNYHWLRDGPGLEMIDQFDNYTLFKVGECA